MAIRPGPLHAIKMNKVSHASAMYANATRSEGCMAKRLPKKFGTLYVGDHPGRELFTGEIGGYVEFCHGGPDVDGTDEKLQKSSRGCRKLSRSGENVVRHSLSRESRTAQPIVD